MSVQYAPNIRRGMAVLDEVRPNWEYQIDLKTLDLTSPCKCIVGQLVEPEQGNRGIEGLGLNTMDYDHQQWPVALGFAQDDVDGKWEIGTYEGLTRAWKRAIKARLSGGAA